MMTNTMLVMTAAMKQETETVTRCLENVRPIEVSGYRAWLGTHRSTTVLALQTGIGKERAERALSSVFSDYEPAAVVSVGFGGALSPEQRAGDIVICTETVGHDPSETTPHKPRRTDEKLLRRAHDVKDGRNHVRISGAGVTVPVVAGAVLKQKLRDNYNAAVCDMEDAWLAGITAKKNVPFMAVRVVLDELHDDLLEYDALGSILDGDGNARLRSAVSHMIAHPGSVRPLCRSYRNYRRARLSLSEFVKGFLDTYAS